MADIPYDGAFTGYGAQPSAGAPSSSYAEEVLARAKKLPPLGASAATAAPEAAATASRFTAPAWLKTAGGFGAKLLSRGGVLGTAALAVPPLAEGLKSASEAAANAYVGNSGSDMSPNPAVMAANTHPAAPATIDGADGWHGDLATRALTPATDAQYQDAMGARNLNTANTPGFGAQIIGQRALSTGLTPIGTGGIRNNTTGQVTGINAGPHEQVQLDRNGNQITGGAPNYANRGLIGGFFGAMGKVSQANIERRQANESAKLGLAGLTAGAAASEHIANANNKNAITALTGRLLDPNATPAQKEEARASLVAMHGRSDTGHLSVPMGGVGMNPQKDPTLVFDKTTGGTRLVMPTVASQRVTDAHVKATMDAHGMTRAAAIKALKEAGHDTSGVK